MFFLETHYRWPTALPLPSCSLGLTQGRKRKEVPRGLGLDYDELSGHGLEKRSVCKDGHAAGFGATVSPV